VLPRSLNLAVGVDLIGQFVDELFKRQVDLGLNFIVQEPRLELVQCTRGCVVVNVERIEHVLHHGGVAALENVIGQDPRQRHVDRELNALVEIQIELAVPQISDVGDLAQGG
jgi:hypothetical protein